MRFRWKRWNIEHIERHGITPREAEFLVEHARRPFPEMIGDEKRYVAGKTDSGLYAQAIYILDPNGTGFVIHARPLNNSEKRKFRRRIR